LKISNEYDIIFSKVLYERSFVFSVDTALFYVRETALQPFEITVVSNVLFCVQPFLVLTILDKRRILF